MKKLFFLVICTAILLIGCDERRANNEIEMLEVINKELGINNSVQIIGTINLDDIILVCFMTGSEYQGHTYEYAEFIKLTSGYRFVRFYPMMDRGMDIRSALYKSMYLFLSNNKKVKSLRVRYSDGKEELIDIEKVPFLYYIKDGADKIIEYHFLDENSE